MTDLERLTFGRWLADKCELMESFERSDLDKFQRIAEALWPILKDDFLSSQEPIPSEAAFEAKAAELQAVAGGMSPAMAKQAGKLTEYAEKHRLAAQGARLARAKAPHLFSESSRGSIDADLRSTPLGQAALRLAASRKGGAA